MEQINKNIHAYATYPRQFSPYKWYKPLLVGLIGIVMYFIASSILALCGYAINIMKGMGTEALSGMMSGGYDTMNTYTAAGAIISLGSIAVIIPVLMLANRIINSRPFSSYSSSRGGFDFKIFFKCLLAAVVLVGVPLSIQALFFDQHSGIVQFTVVGFILCTILVPLQCVAEEYFTRGYLLQTFGSWFKIPVLAIILQAVIFAALHPYNIIGVISTLISGLTFGFCVYITNGIEASSAMHIVNNMLAFYFAGFGLGAIHTNVDIPSFIMDIFVCVLYLAFIIFADKKLGWFNHKKKDDVSEFNAKIEAKRAAKATKAA